MTASYRGLTPLRALKQRNSAPPPAIVGVSKTPSNADRHRATADQIILAGKLRRNEIAVEGPDPKSLAGQILRAGRIRRGEEQE